MKQELQIHNIPPLYDAESKILMLGSFPSPKSREAQFFYGHPQNRYWKVLPSILGEEVPGPGPEFIPVKADMMHRHHIAMWDVIGSCTITGASDTSIRDVVPNDLTAILETAEIRAIFTNGAKSTDLYRKYIFPVTGIPSIKLPSSSPANAQFSLERLTAAWQELLEPFLPLLK